MAANYSLNLKNDRMACILTRLDAQVGSAQLVIFTAAYATILATIILPKPSFTLSGGVLTLNGAPLSAVCALSGTAALAQFQDSNATWWVQGLTVGTSAADIILNSVSLVAGQVATCTGAALTAAA
jgi:hypothetical protein